jgi:3-methyladenine DNA glycosylase AlkC
MQPALVVYLCVTMPEPLKNYYSPAFFDTLSTRLSKAIKGFDKPLFIAKIFYGGWETLELKQRMRHVAVVLHDFLPHDFKKAADSLIKITDVLLDGREGAMDFLHMFLPDYVELYGIDDYENSMRAFEKITCYASAEFAIRPFIVRYPQTMQQMLVWSKHPNPYVRRLSSEGCRPRLPWAMALPALKKDPAQIVPILENLKADPAETVRRSVANNLNDIAKDNADVVMSIVKRWQGSHANTDWIIKHGSRTLLKKGHEDALDAFGLKRGIKVQVDKLAVAHNKLKIGEKTILDFTITLKEKQAEKLRVEYGVYYVKANGTANRKLFKITENNYSPDKAVAFNRALRFHDMTTRKHYVGVHKITIVINGKEYAETALELL